MPDYQLRSPWWLRNGGFYVGYAYVSANQMPGMFGSPNLRAFPSAPTKRRFKPKYRFVWQYRLHKEGRH